MAFGYASYEPGTFIDHPYVPKSSVILVSRVMADRRVYAVGLLRSKVNGRSQEEESVELNGFFTSRASVPPRTDLEG